MQKVATLWMLAEKLDTAIKVVLIWVISIKLLEILWSFHKEWRLGQVIRCATWSTIGYAMSSGLNQDDSGGNHQPEAINYQAPSVVTSHFSNVCLAQVIPAKCDLEIHNMDIGLASGCHILGISYSSSPETLNAFGHCTQLTTLHAAMVGWSWSSLGLRSPDISTM